MNETAGQPRFRTRTLLFAGAALLVVIAAVVAVVIFAFTRTQDLEVPGLVSTSVESGEPTILQSESGARIVVPALETSEDITVYIRDVAPPASHVSVGNVFDFSLKDESGQDFSLDQPVTITLPYTLPEGRDHSDVVVLYWNEDAGSWEPVEGGEIDRAAQTITVQVSHLSTFGISWLLSFAEFLVDSAEVLIGATFGQHYEQGNKHLLIFKAGGGTHKINGDISLIIDVDDLLGITEEGKAGYVTTWMNATLGLGQISWSNTLPVGIYFFVHDRSDGDDDPRFKAKFKSLSGSATLGNHVVGLEALTVQNGQINPAGGGYQVCLSCTETSQAISLSWADLTWNARRAELRLRPSDKLFENLKGRLGEDENSVDKISAEEFASEVIGSTFEVVGDEIRAIFDEPSAPFTSYDQPSPKDAIDWYGSLQNQIVGHCGGENRYGPSSELCSDGDMLFPSHIDSSGSPVVETPLRLSVKGDARETRDYFVNLVDISPGWEIKVDRDSDLWAQLVTLLLYNDRAQFEARAGAYHFIPFLVGSTPFAPNPGVATFELVHVKGFADDEVLDRYRVELWQGRDVGDLSVNVTPERIEAIPGENITLVANVTNGGPNGVDQAALHIDVPSNGNVLLSSSAGSTGGDPCRKLYFGKLLCQLGPLNSNQTVTVELDFSLSGVSPEEGDYVDLQTSSTTYDPQNGNNRATPTILINSSTTGPTQPDPRPPVVQPPPPTSASDREALIALYDATRGEYWYNNRNGINVWEVDDENSGIGSWHRVTVNSAGRVTELYPSSNDLRYDRDHRNSLPPELGNLAYLEWLDLSGNDLRGRIPDAFGNLRNLVELHLNNNHLRGEIPASLGNLINLESLDLSNNNLSGEIPIGLGSLPRMDVVYLGGNNLSGCIPAEWRRMQGDLDELDLPYCDVALNDLAISPGRLDPEFEPSERRYSAEIAAHEITLVPTNRQGASFQFLDASEQALIDEDASKPGHQIQLTTPTTRVDILVTSPDGRRDHSYTIEISRSPGAPGAPEMNPISPGSSLLSITWDAPSDTGSSAISSYSLRYRRTGTNGPGDAPWTVVHGISSPSLGNPSYDLVGLQPNVQYDVQVRAVNATGPGPWSETVSGTTVSATVPEMPVNLTAASIGPSAMRLSWQQPISDGGSLISGYHLQNSQDRADWVSLEEEAHLGTLIYTHTSLSAGDTWHYRVAAINSLGQGPWSNVASASTESLEVPEVPDMPLNPAASAAGTSAIRLSWSPPAFTGSGPVTGYRIEVSPNGARWSTLASVGPLESFYSHDGLEAGATTHYRVAASNGVGVGPWSGVVDGRTLPAGVPGPPENVVANAGGPGEILLSWQPPVSDGGLAVLGYVVHVSTDGSRWSDLTTRGRRTLSYSHSGIPSGSTLRYRVGATNAVGMGAWSSIVEIISDSSSEDTAPGSPVPGSPEADRDALVALYNATGGPNWTNKDNWLSDRAVSTWNGVQTGHGGRVTTLDLYRNGLSGEIPDQLQNLTALETLILSENRLRGQLPVALGSLSNLQNFFISGGNEFSGCIPRELQKLPPKDLRSLDLYYCTTPGAERDKETLISFYYATGGPNWKYSDNWLTDAPLHEWHGVRTEDDGFARDLSPDREGRVTWLQLFQGNLVGEIPPGLGNLSELRKLNLHRNNLSGEIPTLIGDLHELDYLNLHSNQLTGSIPSGIGNLRNLEYLDLSQNQLNGEIPSGLDNMTNLLKLSLSYNQLSGEFPKELERLSKLRWLTVGENQLTGCLPTSLRAIEINDVDQLNLPPATDGGPRWNMRFQNLGNLDGVLSGPLSACAK